MYDIDFRIISQVKQVMFWVHFGWHFFLFFFCQCICLHKKNIIYLFCCCCLDSKYILYITYYVFGNKKKPVEMTVLFHVRRHLMPTVLYVQRKWKYIEPILWLCCMSKERREEKAFFLVLKAFFLSLSIDFPSTLSLLIFRTEEKKE